MLYIDGFALAKLKDELNELLSGRKLTKIYQYDKFSVSLFFKKLNLSLSINPNLPISYISEKKEVAPKKPLSFSLTLKKYLLNGILMNIDQFGLDRILIFNFSKLTELGEKKEYKLIIELMGKHSNLILTNNEFKIIGLLKQFSLEENSLRILMPGVYYKYPVIQKKKSPFEIDKSFFEKEIISYQDILNKIEGFGKISALDCVNSYEDYASFITRETSPTLYLEKNEIKHASFLEYKEFEKFDKQKFDNLNSLINFYITKTINSQQFNNKKRNLSKIVEKEIKKNQKIVKFIKRDIKKGENFEKYKNIADILAANLYQIKRSQEEIELFDFYTNEKVKIQLNPLITANQNLDRYYKKYNKLKRGYNFNLERKELIKNELAYLESIIQSLETSITVDDLEIIQEELIQNKYMKKLRNPSKKKEKSHNIQEFISSDGLKIFVGKNNKENDYLTFKIARKEDMWLHAKDIPGSHVIIKKGNFDEIPEQTILEAAQIAAFYSKLKNENNVQVDFTKKKYVNNPKGSKPGFVTYTHEKAVLVKPLEKI